MSTNPISFRKPPNLRGKVHPEVAQTIQDHDNGIVDLNQANATHTTQIAALEARIAALEKK
jgi:hypothetical protein